MGLVVDGIKLCHMVPEYRLRYWLRFLTKNLLPYIFCLGDSSAFRPTIKLFALRFGHADGVFYSFLINDTHAFLVLGSKKAGELKPTG